MNKQIKFLAIGDIATDVFIKIKEAETECDTNGEDCKLCLDFGGKIPYESVETCYATGNASNVALGVKKLGLFSSMLSYLGDDEIGMKSLKYLKKQRINTKGIKVIKNYKSNYHYVIWYKTDRTILTKHISFPYSFPKKIITPDYIYLSSLAESSLEYHNEIIDFIDKNKKTKLIFQPGTFQIKQGIDKLKNIYERTQIFLCNFEEAQKILNTKEENIESLLKMINGLGPNIVVITNGLKGAYAYDGRDIWFIESYPHKPVESTGAGDAFSSGFNTAIILGKKIEEAMVWGAINAMSVVSQVGPQKGLMTRDKLEKFIKSLGDNYKAKKI